MNTRTVFTTLLFLGLASCARNNESTDNNQERTEKKDVAANSPSVESNNTNSDIAANQTPLPVNHKQEKTILLSARTFQSDIPLRVFAHKSQEDLFEMDGFMRGTDIGQTGADQIIQIPQCHIWFVAPAEPTPDWGTIAAEVAQQHVPGLQALGITDADLSQLASLKHLTYLAIVRGNITDSGLEHVESFRHLQMMVLSNCDNITDAGLKHLQHLENLQMLFLNCTRFTGTGLEHLKNLRNLRVLWADYNNTDANLEHLTNCEKLQSLILIEAKTTDAGLEHLKNLKNLQTLVLESGYGITDVGLKHLETLKNLQMLFLGRAKYTDAGVEALKKALPKCKVLQ